MPWLDAVRYADPAGYHSDGERLRAFLNNKPFDEFTREQLAGDLLPNATLEHKIASAYNRMGRTSAEGGVQPKEYWAKYGADRVRAVGANWLGSTFGCAECHDHKFDPILTKDFYAMKAFFADIKEDGLIPDTGPNAFEPKMPVYKPGQVQGDAPVESQLQQALKLSEDKRSEAQKALLLRGWPAGGTLFRPADTGSETREPAYA